jgi:hypothetical protein
MYVFLYVMELVSVATKPPGGGNLEAAVEAGFV